jgi:hypothetical protein
MQNYQYFIDFFKTKMKSHTLLTWYICECLQDKCTVSFRSSFDTYERRLDVLLWEGHFRQFPTKMELKPVLSGFLRHVYLLFSFIISRDSWKIEEAWFDSRRGQLFLYSPKRPEWISSLLDLLFNSVVRNSGRQLFRATEVCTIMPNICEFSA